MGYATRFEGVLRLPPDTTTVQLAHLHSFFGEDVRDHPDWGNQPFFYVDLELTEDFAGLRWNEAENTRGMVEQINFLLRMMRQDFPTFNLTGQFLAQGAEPVDRWILHVSENEMAVRQEIKDSPQEIICPHCHQSFKLSEVEE